MEVLFEIGSSRKPLTVTRETLVEAVERELAKVFGDACLLPFQYHEEDSTSSKKVMYLLQRWSDKWDAFVDVMETDEVKDGDRLTVVSRGSNASTGSESHVSEMSALWYST